MMSRTYSKTCERCGTTFGCGLSRCWCGQVTVNDRLYEQIVRTYHDCLCPRCLADLTGNSPIDPSQAISE